MTEVDDKAVAGALRVLARVGILATFREWPSLDASDTDASRVIEGTPTDYEVLVTPALERMVMISEGDQDIEVEALKVILATGDGTPNAIPFVPSLSTQETAMVCIYKGVQYRIVKVKPVDSGERIAAYSVYLRKG